MATRTADSEGSSELPGIQGEGGRQSPGSFSPSCMPTSLSSNLLFPDGLKGPCLDFLLVLAHFWGARLCVCMRESEREREMEIGEVNSSLSAAHCKLWMLYAW